jgi:hypothetical protein
VDKWIKLDPSAHNPFGELEDPVKGKLVNWEDLYDTNEEVDCKCPESNGTKSLSTTVYFDSNHAHDEKTRRYVSGILIYVGNCPVYAVSKRQGSIATSKISAELCAAKVGVEESINIRCMLRSLGVPVTESTNLLCDNMGSLISASNPGTPCKKKTSHIAYHFVREAAARRIVNSFQAISVIRGARYGVFTNKKHGLNTLKMDHLLRSDVMLSLGISGYFGLVRLVER